MGLRDRPTGAGAALRRGSPALARLPGSHRPVDVDFGALYGPEWAFLTGRAPVHVALAEGSAVAVYPGRAAATGRLT